MICESDSNPPRLVVAQWPVFFAAVTEAVSGLPVAAARIFICLALCFSVTSIQADDDEDRELWTSWIDQYPVGQSDPFSSELHLLQAVKLNTRQREIIKSRFPEWEVTADLLASFFPQVYQSLQVKFAPDAFEREGQIRFEREMIPHQVDSKMLFSSPRTYSVHVDRYADPRWKGKYSGAVLLVPGTGSYGGNYVEFAMVMSSLKGYIVYVVDPIFHGGSHGHKTIRRNPNGKGTAAYLDRAITSQGQWDEKKAFESGWEEREACKVNMTLNINVIQSIGRRIAHYEKENLQHLNAEALSKPAEARSTEWYGKPVNSLTHVTLIGTSQGGETAFWAADPRATAQGAQAAFDILYPFDSVICHNVYNTAVSAPHSKMRLLQSAFPGNFLPGILDDKDSLWANMNWLDLYNPESLFIRVCDRWVRWRYNMTSYQALLRFGKDYKETMPNMKTPVLVAIGSNDLLYHPERYAESLVEDLFKHLDRDPTGESLWHLEFQTPAGENGHQLLVHQPLEFADMADAWIRYRRSGPGSSFHYESGQWKRIR